MDDLRKDMERLGLRSNVEGEFASQPIHAKCSPIEKQEGYGIKTIGNRRDGGEEGECAAGRNRSRSTAHIGQGEFLAGADVGGHDDQFSSLVGRLVVLDDNAECDGFCRTMMLVVGSGQDAQLLLGQGR